MGIEVAILTIGTELTDGLVRDTNSFFLAKELFREGYTVGRHESVPDKKDRIVNAILKLKQEFKIIIATGGLGPTDDDLTREAISEAFNKELVIDEELIDIAKNSHNEAYSRKLASYPKEAIKIRPFKDSVGGFIIKDEDGILVSLPGVPAEIEAIFTSHILPAIKDFRAPDISRMRQVFKIIGLREVEIEEKLRSIKDDFSYGLLPRREEVYLYITITGEDDIAQRMNILEEKISDLFKTSIYGRDEESLEEVIVKMMSEKNLVLSVAESSTGGLIGQRIISIADASKMFTGGYLTYSNELKEQIGVKKQTLIDFGAVSEQVAAQMAEQTLIKTGSDIAVSVTGIAGPKGATENKPLGLHYISVAAKGRDTTTRKFIFRGDRNQVRFRASQQALILVRDTLLSNQND